jgi:hypothetical protein
LILRTHSMQRRCRDQHACKTVYVRDRKTGNLTIDLERR